MFYRAATVLITFFSIAACTPQGPSNEEIQQAVNDCGGVQRCVIATLVTREYQGAVGQPLGQGVSIKGAETDGRVISLAIVLPERVTSEPVRDGKTPEQQLEQAFRDDLCGDPNTKRFFDMGGELVVTSYLPSGARFAKSTVDAC